MLEYRGGHLARPGVIGLVLIVCVIAIGLQSQKLITYVTTVRYEAVFTEAGGIAAGDDVVISGVQVGHVTKVTLREGDAHVVFAVQEKIRLGTHSSAHIKTGSLLGKRTLDLVSEGIGRMRSGDVIPASHTTSPYSLTDAVSDLTTNAGATDTKALNNSLDLLSSTLDRIAPQLGPTFDGLTSLSRSLNERDDSLRELLAKTADVTGILAGRSQQVNSLILNANSLLEVLVARRQAIVDLLANTSAVAKQISGLVADNEKDLAPTLDHLNSVLAMLQKNRDNIGKAIPGLAKSATTQGEALSNGPFYTAYVANLLPGQLVQPLVDQAFGPLAQVPAAPAPAPAPGPGQPR